MITISVHNSYSQISGLSLDQTKLLKTRLSYIAGGQKAFFSKYGVKRISLLSKRGEFPTGLLNITINSFKTKITVVDKRIKPKGSNLFRLHTSSMKPYLEQIEAAEMAAKKGRGIISASTGTGKSFIAAMVIRKLQVRTLVVVPTIELKDQLSSAFKAMFGIEIGKGRDIYVENIQALDPKTKLNYDCLIIDEFHHSASKTYQKLNKSAWTGIYYRFGLTATPWRSDIEEKILLESILDEIIYNLDYKTSTQKGYIVPVEAYYYTLPKQKNDSFTYNDVYSQLVVNNEYRNKLIAGLLLKLQQEGLSTLCLVKEVAHGKLLEDLTGAPFVHGIDKASRQYIKRFNTKIIPVLIGTIGVMGEGIDTKPAEFIIIAGLGKAKSAFMQQVGRGVRRYLTKDSCKVIIFKDASHRFTLKHFREQFKILREEYNINAQELFFP